MRLTVPVVLIALGTGVGWVLLVLEEPPAHQSVIYDPGAEASVIRQRILIKRQLAERVLTERIPLLEAAELFRQANGPDGLDGLARSRVPGRSVREKLCRQVIGYVEMAEEDRAAAGRARPHPLVSGVLRAELERRIAAGEFPPDSDD
jgi:hypothetical protein